MPAWQAQIRLGPPAGGWQDVTVQADDMFRAIAMLEAQYGKGSIVAGLRQVSTGIPSAVNAGEIMHRIWVDGTEFRWTREVAAA